MSGVKGWCPGAHRPMMSGDGLVVRLRTFELRFAALGVGMLCYAPGCLCYRPGRKWKILRPPPSSSEPLRGTKIS